MESYLFTSDSMEMPANANTAKQVEAQLRNMFGFDKSHTNVPSSSYYLDEMQGSVEPIHDIKNRHNVYIYIYIHISIWWMQGVLSFVRNTLIFLGFVRRLILQSSTLGAQARR